MSGVAGTRCKLHGGSAAIANLRHGQRSIYSALDHPTLKKLVEQFEAVANPLDTLPEIAAARALFTDFVNRYTEWREAVLAWKLSFDATHRPLPPDMVLAFNNVVDEFEISMAENGDEPTAHRKRDLENARAFVRLVSQDRYIMSKPKTILDIADAYRLLDVISKMAERVEKARAENAVSRRQLRSILEQMSKLVMQEIQDPDVLQRIRQRWLTEVRLEKPV